MKECPYKIPWTPMFCTEPKCPIDDCEHLENYIAMLKAQIRELEGEKQILAAEILELKR